MAEVRIGKLRRSRFIKYDTYMVETVNPDGRKHLAEIRKGYEELVTLFQRNKVDVELKFTGIDVTQNYYMNNDFDKIKEDIAAFCDNHCTGFWAWQHGYSSDMEYIDMSTRTKKNEDQGTGKITIFFENEPDIAVFLKDCAVLLKLAN